MLDEEAISQSFINMFLTFLDHVMMKWCVDGQDISPDQKDMFSVRPAIASCKNHSFTTTRDAFVFPDSRTLEKRYGFEGLLQDRIKLSLW